MKSSTRKHFAKLKKETYATGGGTCNVKPNILYDKVHEIIELSVDGLQNPLDSDCIRGENIIEECDENIDPEIVDPDDPVFQYLVDNEEIEPWSKWNPRKLKSPLSEPLVRAIGGGIQSSSSSSNAKDKFAGAKKKKRATILEENLLQSKIELTNLMQKHMSEKALLEKKILEAQLRKEELNVILVESEALIKHYSLNTS
ncbi:uncharacterized protein [Prorops nasuta]|uniref:uncharacterized protein n=1 Tax=Prorops nasuta TaxID=863751 RepID=UPI0034CDD5B3